MEDSYGDGWQGGNITFYDENGDILAIGSVNGFEANLDLFTGEDCDSMLCDEDQTLYSASLTPDLYGEELVWGVLDQNGDVLAGPFSGYESNISHQRVHLFTRWMSTLLDAGHLR